jgi:hypothetical protein
VSGHSHTGPGDRDLAQIARQMRSALAVVRGRVQVMQRRQARGRADAQPTAAEFSAIDAAIGRLVTLVERIEDEAVGR